MNWLNKTRELMGESVEYGSKLNSTSVDGKLVKLSPFISKTPITVADGVKVVRAEDKKTEQWVYKLIKDDKVISYYNFSEVDGHGQMINLTKGKVKGVGSIPFLVAIASEGEVEILKSAVEPLGEKAIKKLETQKAIVVKEEIDVDELGEEVTYLIIKRGGKFSEVLQDLFQAI